MEVQKSVAGQTHDRGGVQMKNFQSFFNAFNSTHHQFSTMAPPGPPKPKKLLAPLAPPGFLVGGPWSPRPPPVARPLRVSLLAVCH